MTEQTIKFSIPREIYDMAVENGYSKETIAEASKNFVITSILRILDNPQTDGNRAN